MRGLLTAVFIFFSISLLAQDTGRMETDRPDQTESPYITKRGWYQLEMGFNVENQKNGERSFVHPTALHKLGISKWFEFRMITQWESIQTPIMIPAGNEVITGLQPVQVGGKLALFEEKGLRPKTSLIFHTIIPQLASSYFKTDKWAPNFRFTMQNSLSSNVSLGYNLGAEWDGFSNEPTWIYTIAPGFNIGEKWYAYVELFGFLNANNHPQHSADGGLAYYVSPDLKLDISGGFGLTPNTELKNYVAIGLSIRVPVWKKR